MAYSSSRRHGTRMSLEETLEQERRELVDALERRQTRHVQSGLWADSSRINGNNDNDNSHVASTRHGSMMDLEPSPGPLPPRHGSIAGIGVGVTPPSYRRSWNEPISSSPLRLSSSATSSSSSPPSAVELNKEKSPSDSETAHGTDRPQTKRNSVSKIEQSGMKTKTTPPGDRLHIDTILALASGPDPDTLKRATTTNATTTKNPGPSSPSSPTSAQEKGKNSMAAMMSGLDLKVGLPSFARGRDSARRNSSRGSSLDSRFPSSRFSRSISPRNRWLSANPLSLATSSLKPNKSASDKGKVIDMGHAKRLSDTASKLTGSQPVLPRPPSRHGSSDGGPVSSGDERLEKDRYDSENNPISETSDEEDFDSSSSDDEPASRGRKVSIDVISPSDDEGTGDAKERPQSPPAAAEEKHQPVEDKTDSTPNEEEKETLIHSAKRGPQPLNPQPPKPQDEPPKPQIHPSTSFETTSAANTPFGSEDEAELSDIKRAQKLNIQMSSINNTVHNRSIRTIVRGDYANVLEETEGSRRRRRRYMVTTDLSEESVYALEWTIGTILRDGDTMFAVCALHEDSSAGTSVQIGEGAKAMQDSAAIVGSQTEETAQKSQHDPSSTYLSRAILGRLSSGTDSRPGSVDGRGMTKAESERVRAVESISQTCVRLLRKTLLQVRIAVEVIHCKSPKHMITEAIDGLEPTLVIVGARGRSALKGVLLGSFSNYLVTKSSVPVMVARRKLIKKKYKQKKTRNIRFSNNLTTPKSLAMAKVD